MDTTVDSEIARFYLESYPAKENQTHPYYQAIASLYQTYDKALPTREELKAISQSHSVDVAALFFADRILSQPCNKELNAAFSEYVTTVSKRKHSRTDKYIVLFVPGWNYVENGYVTGADFAKPRRLVSEYQLENYLVGIPPTGSVSENAAVLTNEIRRHARSNKQIILVGASSAGPAIHLTLGKLLRDDERRSVSAWLNVGGLLQGSPLIDFIQRPPQSWGFSMVLWSRGWDWDMDALDSLSAAVSRKRFAEIPPFSDVLVINYLGIPLSGQLSIHTKDKYRVLRKDGPNDGLTLLRDAIAPNSLTIVAFGRDHFIAEDPLISLKTVALMHLILDYLETEPASQCR